MASGRPRYAGRSPAVNVAAPEPVAQGARRARGVAQKRRADAGGASAAVVLQSGAMSAREPVHRRHFIARVTPGEVYAIVTDFAGYPRLFPEIKQTRVVSTTGNVVRVEFRAQVVLAVRYVLDLVCDPAATTVDWTFVEGEIVTDSVGGWRFSAEGDGTAIDYRAALEIRAPLPGFVLRKVTDGLVAASLPSMFASIEREVRGRQRPEALGLRARPET